LEGQAVIEYARESVRSVEAMTVSTRAEVTMGSACYSSTLPLSHSGNEGLGN
jgi:hypothetical protein